MKLVTLNVGIKIDNAPAVGDFLQKVGADFIALQEVIRHLDSSVFPMYQSKSVIESFLKNTFPFSFFGPLWITEAFRKDGEIFRDFGGFIEQGNEILSKFPIVTAVNEHFYKHYSYEIDWTNFRQVDHPRAVQVVEFEVNGKRLQILNLHGIWTEDKRGDERTIAECQHIVDSVKRRDIATIITGDFNLLPDTESIGILNKNFRNLIDEFHISTTRPDFKDSLESGNTAIDYVFVNDKVDVVDFQVLNSDISDHLPLLFEFEIK